MNPSQPVSTACNAMHDVALPDHDELIQLAFVYRAVVGRTGSLSQSCQKSVMDQLNEMAAEIDQDFVNQQAEQAWHEQEGRRLAA